MPTPLTLLTLTLTQPTLAVPSGAVYFAVDVGSGGPLTVSIPGQVLGTMDAPAPQHAYAHQQALLAPGKYVYVVYDASPLKLASLEIPFTIDPVPEPVLGCQNPDADNYGAPSGTCTFSPKLAITRPAELAALGRPVWAALASAPVVYATASAATATLTLATLANGDVLTINGYRFVVGALTTPDRFQDADTLAEALQAVPALATAYLVSATASAVQLTARAVGPAANLVLTTTSAGVTCTSSPGQPATHSQRRAGWGCWLEVWALPGLPYGGTDKTGAQLAAGYESRYREDNSYQFDISACLRAFTSLSYELSGRTVGYFLRYGETFADAVGGYRRRRAAVGETSVFFGLEAVEIRPADADGARLLTQRPGAWQVIDGATPQVAVLLPTAAGVQLEAFEGDTYPAQRVDAPVLSFVNGQGGRETVVFEGLREELTKRTTSLYNTATGQGMQKAETPPGFRLQSGLLPRDEWDWLRLELGNSPAVWLETAAGPAPLVVSALTTDGDEVKGEYTLLVECAFCLQPALGLTN